MVMPVCTDDDSCQDTHMPYVEDAEKKEDACALDAWFSWLTGGCSKKDGPHKESDLVPTSPMCPMPCPSGMGMSPPLDPPNCMEDPDYSKQYPGCPHMGGCPGHGPCCPPMEGPMAPPVEKGSKDGKANPMSLFQKTQFSDPPTPDAGPGVGKLDTMECRPSDLPNLKSSQPY
jgi:hypothetical protein